VSDSTRPRTSGARPADALDAVVQPASSHERRAAHLAVHRFKPGTRGNPAGRAAGRNDLLPARDFGSCQLRDYQDCAQAASASEHARGFAPSVSASLLTV
jgi:hypothetical protein